MLHSLDNLQREQAVGRNKMGRERGPGEGGRERERENVEIISDPTDHIIIM